MRHHPARQSPPATALPERIARQRHLLAKLERDGYRCEVIAARRRLRALQAEASPRRLPARLG